MNTRIVMGCKLLGLGEAESQFGKQVGTELQARGQERRHSHCLGSGHQDGPHRCSSRFGAQHPSPYVYHLFSSELLSFSMGLFLSSIYLFPYLFDCARILSWGMEYYLHTFRCGVFQFILQNPVLRPVGTEPHALWDPGISPLDHQESPSPHLVYPSQCTFSGPISVKGRYW